MLRAQARDLCQINYPTSETDFGGWYGIGWVTPGMRVDFAFVNRTLGVPAGVQETPKASTIGDATPSLK